ncbi:hypothetical protein [uncultured Piscinibacter sp.]|nr:hypothetical protein [uncultured Piscinibacter sp.]
MLRPSKDLQDLAIVRFGWAPVWLLRARTAVGRGTAESDPDGMAPS